MNLRTTLLLALSVLFSGLYAQCTLPAGTGCGAGPNLTGTVIIFKNSTVNLPGTYGGVTYTGFSGTVELILQSGSTLNLGDEFMLAQGTTFSPDITHTNGNPIVVANGTSYNRTNAPPEDFATLSNLLSSCTDAAGCTVGSVLPVTLMSWEARPNEKSNGVNLEWSSQSESGNDYYFVEHSQDGISFQELTRLTGRGDYNVAADYSFQHTDVAAGNHFYRLGQQDLDGTTTRFGIRNVVLTAGGELGVYPNPAAKGSMINLNQAGVTGQVLLLDMNGREIELQPVDNGGGQTTLQLPTSLKPGIYLLRTEKGSVRVTIR